MSTPEETIDHTSPADRDGPDPARSPIGTGPSEEQVHREHAAALEATLFDRGNAHDEVVLELDSGTLRLRALLR